MGKQIVGVRRYDFEDKTTGKPVRGYWIYLNWKEDRTEGLCCEAISLSDAKMAGYMPSVGAEVRVAYNKYRKADFLVPCVNEPF